MNENQLGTDRVTQIGIVVNDIEKARTNWARLLGVEPPPIIETAGFDQAKTHYFGQPSNARAKLCFFKMGQVDIELIEPDQEPSAWRDHLNRHGESVQHLAVVTQNMATAQSGLSGQGIEVTLCGEFSGGRYAYVNSAPLLGVDLELLEID